MRLAGICLLRFVKEKACMFVSTFIWYKADYPGEDLLGRLELAQRFVVLRDLSTYIASSMVQRANRRLVVGESLLVRRNACVQATSAGIDQAATLPCIAKPRYDS